MAAYEDREAFIPYRRPDLIDLCIEEGRLSGADVRKFRDFCSLLSAYYHFKFHAYLERLKDNYEPFNPDADIKSRVEPTLSQLVEMETKVVDDFKSILERANYVPLSPASLQRAFEEKSLIHLKTKVELKDFDQMVCYCRGDIYKLIQVKKFFKKVDKTINSFQRVALLIKFKDESYFVKQKVKLESLNFTPGKMYIYFYKNIPKFDMELLFPNLKISMTWKDRLMLVIPAIGAAIPVILKVIPKLLVIIGAILFFTAGPSLLEKIQVSEEQVRDIMPVLVATLSLLVSLGGFAFKQYSSYKSKHIKFRKNITDTLFFKNLANNASVFQVLIDAAEEEECKEIILAYYHLLTSDTPLTPEQLDNRIEDWMDEKLGMKIDFDINGPIGNLQQIRGKIVKGSQDRANTPEFSLLTKDERGYCQVLSLDDAKTVIDYIWDNIFLYT
ncbi:MULTISPECIES: TMEM143 family protein [unclassified Coleofasciculus]|uniref:TMEM143 family protein n=1 Tax=unclassified Coleofasciculus TaxID=2692782 RepID=UPI00188225D0|nr:MULTISPECIES: TMEM143 family protein [unclassified Coleofasciculus]MBE9129410.1 DUF3754 domain-containing protein [Coleofasciculus sp. LEGE 07081]MBE9152049.1 DUF3754 domain-containing protein [Coleofasciculus sp. LEGE 07092]